jgi:hypothetical protein
MNCTEAVDGEERVVVISVSRFGVANKVKFAINTGTGGMGR